MQLETKYNRSNQITEIQIRLYNSAGLFFTLVWLNVLSFFLVVLNSKANTKAQPGW